MLTAEPEHTRLDESVDESVLPRTAAFLPFRRRPRPAARR